MRKFKVRKIWSLLIALTMVLGIEGGVAVQETMAAAPWSNLNPTQVAYRHNSGHDYQVEDPDWVNVYCLDPAKGYSDRGRNMNFRWKFDLKATPALIDRNAQDVNGSHKGTSANINRLVSILWYAKQLNASIDDTQNAVWYYVTQGSDDNYTGNVSKYNNYVVKAAGDSGWSVPGSYELYLYAPDLDVPSFNTTQNMVRFTTSAEPDNPPAPPTPPEWKLSTRVTAAGQTGDPVTIKLKPGQTKTEGLYIEDKIIYDNMQAEAGHKIWVMPQLRKLNDDGSTEFVRWRSATESGEEYWINNNQFSVDASGKGEWTAENATGIYQDLEPGTYYLTMGVYDANTGMQMTIDGKDDPAERIVIEPGDKLPTVKTSASPKKIDAAAGQEITDTVTLTGLIKDVEYTITGTLMDKDKQAPVEGVTCEPVKFTASADDAAADSVKQEMKFTGIDASALAGKELVVFETLSWTGDAHGDTNEVKHEDYDDADQTVGVKDGKEILISKQNIYGDEIEGAKIQIKQDDKVVEQWVSTTEPHAISLEAGTYVFHEESVPTVEYVDENGKTQTVDLYTVVTDVTFTVDANGKVTTETEKQIVEGYGDVEINTASDNQLIVKNLFNPQLPYTPGELLISKVDLGGEELPGAKIQILDIDGEKVLEWTSTNEVHTIPASDLAMGTQYIFHEVAAPNGYAKVTDIPFMINMDGMVDVLDANENAAAENNHLTITDRYEGKLSTTVSAGGKTATSKRAATLTAAQAEKVTTVTDTIKAESLMPNASYKVTGELMQIVDGKAKSTGVKTTRTYKTDADGNGTWKMPLRKVKLAAGAKYVVFETAVNADDETDTYEHADINDKAQTIVVGKARTTSARTSASTTSKSRAVKTGDDSNVLLWSLILAGAAVVIIIAARRRRSR